MAIIGSAYVEIRALDTNLQRDIDKAMKKVKEPLITLQSNVNLTPVRDKIRVLREELKKNPLKFSAEVDLEKANDKLKTLREAQTAEILTIEANADAGAVVATLEGVKQQYQSIHANIKADADTAIAETQLRLLARNRSTRVSAFIDPQTQKALTNLLYTLTGALPADKIRKVILGLAGNFEGLAIGGAKLATVLGSIGAAGLTLGANLISIGDDILELVGISALAPAVIAGIGAGIAATTMAWKGFGKALKDDKELAKLPPEARAANLAVRGLGTSIKVATQTSYWKEMGTALQDMTKSVVPKLRDGLAGTGKAMAKWTKGMFASFKQLADSGGLDKMFKHINTGLTNASKGVKPFFDALAILGVTGSRYLDKMGDQLAGLGIKFNNWITAADKAGDIDKWIMQASDNFEDLGRTIGATWEIFGGLNKAAAASGAATLDDFANGMERIADKVNSPEFQTGLITVLKGARAGSDALGKGFGKITDVIGKGADTIARFLDLAGQIGGGIFTGIAAMFDNTGLGDGLITGLEGAKAAIDILQPAFSDFGKIVGDLAEIAGTLFTSMAPGVVALMATLQGFVNGIKDGIIAAMPIFNEFIQNIISVASGPIIALGEALGNILKFFAGLPGPVQTFLMSMAAAALIAPRVEKAYGAMRKGVNGHFTNMKNNARDWGNSLATNLSGYDRASRAAIPTVRQNFGALNTSIRDSFTATGRSIADVSRTTNEGVKKSFSQTGSAIGSGFTAAGKVSASAVSSLAQSVKSDMAATVQATKNGFKHMEMESRPLRNNTRYLMEDMADGAKKHTALASEYVRQHTVYTEKRFADAAQSVKGAGADIASGFKAVGPNIATQMNPAVTAVKGFASDTRQAMAAVASDVTSRYNAAGRSVGNAFSGAALKAKAHLEPITTAARGMATQSTDAIRRLATGVADDFRAVGSNVSSAMLPVVSTAERAAQGTRNAFRTAGTDISDGMRAIGQNFSSAMLPVTTGAQNAATRVRDSFRTMGQNMASNFAPVNAAIRNLGTQVVASTQTAGTAVRNFTTTAGAQITSGLGKAMGGLGAAFGGPWGIAIAGVIASVGLIGAKAEEQKGKVTALKDAFNGQAGITAAVEEVIVANLKAKDSFLWMEQSSAVDVAEDIGVSLRDLTLAAQGVPDAMTRVGDSITGAWSKLPEVQKGIDMFARLHEGSLLGGVADMFQSDAQRMGRKAEEVRDNLKKAQEEIQKSADMMGVPVNTASGIVSAIDTLIDKAATADSKMRAMQDLIKQITGDTGAADAQQAYNDKVRNFGSDFKSIMEQAKKEKTTIPKIFHDTTGEIDTLTGAGSRVRTMYKDIASAGIASAIAQAQAAKTPAEGQKVFQAAIDTTRAKLAEGFKAGGITNKAEIEAAFRDLGLSLSDVQIRALLDPKTRDQTMKELGLIAETKIDPKKVEVTVDDKATAPVDEIGRKIQATPGANPAIGITDNVTPVLPGLQGTIWDTSGKEVEIKALDGVTLPTYLMNEEIRKTAGKEVTVSAKDGVTVPVGDMKKAVSSTEGKTVAVTAKADTKPLTYFQTVINGLKVPPSPVVTVKDSASAVIAGIQGKISAMKGTSIEVKIKDSASAIVSAIQGKISGMKGTTLTISATDRVSSVVHSIQSSLDNMRDRTVTITTVNRSVSTSAKGANGGIARSMSNIFGGSLPLAKVKSFATGGIEKHVAQISAGQTPYRVWSEPETGGEAYIPLSKAKRARSTKILEEVARMFGMTLLKTKSFANGGVEGGSSNGGPSGGSLSSSNVSAALLTSVAKALMKDNTNLNKVGEYVVDGIIGGVNNKSGAAVNAMTDVAGSLEDAVRDRLEIRSPSKTFLGLGKHIIDGLTISIKAGAGQVHKQISTLANRIYVAASDIKKATGRSIGSSMRLLNHQKTLNSAWKKMSSAKYSDQIVDYYQRTGKTGNRTLADIARAREDVNYRLANAQKRLKDLQTARGDVFKAVSNQISNEYKLSTNIIGETKPYIPKMRFSDVMKYTSGMASRLRAFNGKIAALRKKGIAPGLIQEVAMLGSIEGTSIADAMLQGTSAEVKNLNKEYASIGSSAKAIGNNTADAMYKVGIDAQAGLVRGLSKDSASLTQAANKLTNQLIRQVKKNLGIRSPSRVFAELGRFTGAGFIQGLDQMQPKLDNRVDNFINLDPRTAGSSSSTTAVTTTTSPLADKNLTVHVHPSQGMDERAVAKATVTEIGWAILSQ